MGLDRSFLKTLWPDLVPVIDTKYRYNHLRNVRTSYLWVVQLDSSYTNICNRHHVRRNTQAEYSSYSIIHIIICVRWTYLQVERTLQYGEDLECKESLVQRGSLCPEKQGWALMRTHWFQLWNLISCTEPKCDADSHDRVLSMNNMTFSYFKTVHVDFILIMFIWYQL